MVVTRRDLGWSGGGVIYIMPPGINYQEPPPTIFSSVEQAPYWFPWFTQEHRPANDDDAQDWNFYFVNFPTLIWRTALQSKRALWISRIYFWFRNKLWKWLQCLKTCHLRPSVWTFARCWLARVYPSPSPCLLGTTSPSPWNPGGKKSWIGIYIYIYYLQKS